MILKHWGKFGSPLSSTPVQPANHPNHTIEIYHQKYVIFFLILLINWFTYLVQNQPDDQIGEWISMDF